MYKYIHSGEIEELADVVPYEDFTDYTAEDFIQDHAIVTVGDDEDIPADLNQNDIDDGDDGEPNVKRFRNEYDSLDNEGSNDYDRYGNNSPGIPSLLNLNIHPPRRGVQEDTSEKSPTLISPWESSNYNNGSNQNSNKAAPTNKDRRGRQGGSRWSSSRR